MHLVFLPFNINNNLLLRLNYFPSFVCAKPVELHLQPILKQNPRLPPCPVQHENHLPVSLMQIFIEKI